MGNKLCRLAENGMLEDLENIDFKKCDINSTNCCGCTAVFLAARNDHGQVVQFLKRKGADVNKINRSKQTPLWIAASSGFTDIVFELLSEGPFANDANPNLATRDNVTPLHIAASKNHERICFLLINEHPDTNLYAARISDGYTALHIAAEGGYTSIVKEILAKDIYLVDKKTENTKITPLYLAASQGRSLIVKELLEKNASINVATYPDNETPLYAACKNCFVDVVEILLITLAKVNVATSTGMTPLHIACSNNSLVICKLLLKFNADINLRNNDGKLPEDLAYDLEITNMMAAVRDGNHHVIL